MVGHDRLFKELLSTFFVEFIELFLPELFELMDDASIVFLDKEIFTDITTGEAHEVDLLAKVRLRRTEAFFLIHTESQARKQRQFGRRMFHYFARLHEKYGLPVYPIAVFSFDGPKRAQPSEYILQFPDFRVLKFQYRVIQLNQLSWRDFLNHENPVAAALMAKMRIARRDRVVVKLECLKMIVRLKLDKARSRLIAGFVDSYLSLTKSEQRELNANISQFEGPKREELMEIVTSWMKEGIKQGRKEGRKEEASSLMIKLMTKRFGAIENSLRDRMLSLSLKQMEEMIIGKMSEFESIADVERYLATVKR